MTVISCSRHGSSHVSGQSLLWAERNRFAEYEVQITLLISMIFKYQLILRSGGCACLREVLLFAPFNVSQGGRTKRNSFIDNNEKRVKLPSLFTELVLIIFRF